MTLSPHTIKAAVGSRRSTKKRGRGNASGHGNYSGRGGKGQTARSGGQRGLRLKGFKTLMQSTPKLRGFTSRATKPTEIYLDELNKKFDDGAEVSVATLQAKKLISSNAKAAKVLNTGEITKKLNFVGIAATAGAKAKIEKAGGSVK